MKKKQWFKMMLAMVVCTLAFTACAGGTSQITQPSADEGVSPIEITGKCSIEKKENQLKVSCETNLQNGAVIQISIDSYQGEQLASKLFTVASETFATEFEVQENWPDIVYGTVLCSPTIAEQPDEIRAAYGKRFQNIKGDSVLWNTDGNMVVLQSEKLELK